jgi:hypothetical protein
VDRQKLSFEHLGREYFLRKVEHGQAPIPSGNKRAMVELAFEGSKAVASVMSQVCLVNQERIQFWNKSSSDGVKHQQSANSRQRRGALTKSGTRETIGIVSSA